MFALPLILSALLSQSYNFVNSMMIGNFIGSEAFAATAVTAELIHLLDSIFFGYLAGIGVYISILYGKNEYEKMMKVIKLNFLLTSSLAIVISLSCNIFCKEIFDLLNVGEDIYKNAEVYFRTYTLGYIVFQFNWGFTYISHAFGQTRIPLISSVSSGIINVALNYFFLALLGKGIEFSALSTLISSSVTTAIYFFIFVGIFKGLGISKVPLTKNKQLLSVSFSYGAPTMLQQMAMYLCTALVSPLTNTCSTVALAGYAVANKARSLMVTVYQNSSKANTNFIGQAMGAGRIDKLKEGIKVGVTQGLVLFGTVLLVFVIFAERFSLLFLDSVKDAESIKVSVNIIRFLFPFIVFNLFNNLFHGIFRAVGSGRLMFISTMIYSVSYVIYAYTLFAVLPEDLKIYGVHTALSLAYITEVIFAAIIFFSGKWKSKEYLALEAKCVEIR
jgi:putative MATE family efflux protein